MANACQTHPSAGSDGYLIFASNDLLYAAAYLNDQTGAVLAVKRDFYPACPDQSVNVAHNTAVAVGFGCGDRNGDAIASYNVAASPVSGILGRSTKAAVGSSTTRSAGSPAPTASSTRQPPAD